ncbi:MAG: zf-HC2 domain-containing protein [Anaerolineae bacterium]|nr:zf-HC2 domain-containing protein [Anaerolineae bacterium]
MKKPDEHDSHDQSHEHTHDKDMCRRYLGSLSDYVDGTLGDELCEELEAHISVCENCRVVVDTLGKTVTLYHQLPSPELPDAVKSRLYTVLDLTAYVPESRTGSEEDGQ